MNAQRPMLVKNGLVLLPDAEASPHDILLEDGKIAAITPAGERAPRGVEIFDASGKVVFPGLIDAHVHFGFGEPVTEYTTETIYAAQGGFTSIVAYLLKNDSYFDHFEKERTLCDERSFVDYGFHFSAATELHLSELTRYAEELGVNSFKYFMNFKQDEGRYLGLDGTDDGYLLELLHVGAKIPGSMMVIHAENIEMVNRVRKKFQLAGLDSLKDYCLSKPTITETESMMRAMFLAEREGARIYFPHLSCADGLVEAQLWRKRYESIYLETCPHYLTHDYDSPIGSVGRANPPFRGPEDIPALWKGLADGSIDTVASDHVPRKLATKQKGVWQASQGFPGTATILPVLLSEGYHKGRLSLRRIGELVSAVPARLFGLDRRKGSISVGKDGDLTVVDLEKIRTVRAAELGSYSDYSLYDGWDLKGWPVATILRGQVMMRDGVITGTPGSGRFLRRPDSAA
jgi:dihydropyrimidinase